MNDQDIENELSIIRAGLACAPSSSTNAAACVIRVRGTTTASNAREAVKDDASKTVRGLHHHNRWPRHRATYILTIER